MTDLEKVIQGSQKLSDRSKDAYLKAVRRFQDFAGTDPEYWTGESVERWRDALLKTMSPQSVNTALAGLRYASKRRAERSGSPHFAAFAEKAKAKPAAARRALTYEEAKRMLSGCDDSLQGQRDKAILLLGIKAALRREGIANLKIGDFDFSTHALSVLLKGGRRITITLDDETAQAIKTWLDARVCDPAAPMFVGFNRPGVRGAPVLRQDGLTVNGIYAIIKKRSEAAGLTDVHPHILRHTCITWLRESGVSQDVVRSLTGHTNNKLVDHYTHNTATAPVAAGLPKLG